MPVASIPTRRFVSLQTLRLRKSLALWYFGVGLFVFLLLLGMWFARSTPWELLKFIALWGLSIFFAFTDSELVTDAEGLCVTYYFSPKRYRLISRRYSWRDHSKIAFHTLPRAAAKRYEVVARIVPNLNAQMKLASQFVIYFSHWIEESDIAAYEALLKSAPRFRFGSARLMYSDAPKVFALEQVFREQGFDPGDFSFLADTGAIDLAKTAVKSAMWLGAGGALLAIAIGIQSEWLYVEPQLAWCVGALVGFCSSVVIAIWGRATHCDLTSIFGAVVAGALGLALFGAVVAPDASALLERNSSDYLFYKSTGGEWKTDAESSPVKVLPEPPLRYAGKVAKVHIACGLPGICAFKRTDFKNQ
jgi:hypothetical protein